METREFIPENNLFTVVKNHELANKIVFKPSKDFYNSMNIGQKRFWQLVRSEACPTLEEACLLASFFNVTPDEIISYKTS